MYERVEPRRIKPKKYKLCYYCKEYNHKEKAVYELNGLCACEGHKNDLQDDYIKYKEDIENGMWRW